MKFTSVVAAVAFANVGLAVPASFHGSSGLPSSSSSSAVATPSSSGVHHHHDDDARHFFPGGSVSASASAWPSATPSASASASATPKFHWPVIRRGSHDQEQHFPVSAPAASGAAAGAAAPSVSAPSGTIPAHRPGPTGTGTPSN